MMITTPEERRARQMSPVLVAFRTQVERILNKVRNGDALTEAERGYVASVLEDCAKAGFNKAHFWLSHMVEAHANAEKEG